MKKLLLFSVTLFFLISCSKESSLSSLSPASNFGSSIDKQMFRIDSTSKMNVRGVCVKSKLTQRIIDSLKKMEILNDGSFTGIFPEINSAQVIGDEYTDGSGQIRLKIFTRNSTVTNHPYQECPVDEGWVLVGGGVQCRKGNSFWHEAASYMVTSRPNDDLTAWIGSSKDHYYVNPHYITVYAIGMKLNGVDPAYLKSKIHLHTQQGTMANHPYASANISSNELLIGGGAYDHWFNYGNMLVVSYPASRYTWYAEGKDHHWADPGIMTAYAIGIENIDFPNFGHLETSTVNDYYDLSYTSVSIPSGWAMTCSAGYIGYSGLGVLMHICYPETNTSSFLQSMDCYPTGYGSPRAYAIVIRKVQ